MFVEGSPAGGAAAVDMEKLKDGEDLHVCSCSSGNAFGSERLYVSTGLAEAIDKI